MAEDGFDMRELTRYSRRLLNMAQQQFPQETKQFLRKEAGTLNKRTKEKAKREVGKNGKGEAPKENDKRYLAGFKKGKAYLHEPTNSYAVRVYNSRPHAHLIEYGHEQAMAGKYIPAAGQKGAMPGLGKQIKQGRIKGKLILRTASEAFEQEFIGDTEQFIDDMLQKGLGL